MLVFLFCAFLSAQIIHILDDISAKITNLSDAVK